MERTVAVLVTPSTGAAPPPGVAREEFTEALVEDTYDAVAGLELVTAALVLWPGADGLLVPASRLAELTWPGSPVLEGAGGNSGPVSWALAELADRGARQAALVAADSPDLPGLLLGKLFRGLGGADAAVCPAEGGGLVALAAALPAASWLPEVRLDDADALDRLADARPRRAALSVAPGWHRMRGPADVARLDPGLEGWDATRTLLESGGRHRA